MILLTFDIEERFHSHLTPPDAARGWKVGDRIALLLDWLGEHKKKATMFVVGELAEHYPALVRRMAAEGHEVASHTQTHLRLDPNAVQACVADIRQSKEVLEDITGVEVRGFRAPSWTARQTDLWLWEALAELGFSYDSSLFPFKTHKYGSMTDPLQPFALPHGLVEIPPAVGTSLRLRVPYGGGFYFRVLPLWLIRRLLRRDRRAGHTPVLYFHPWEFEPQQQVQERGALNRFIGNVGVEKAWGRFVRLIGPLPTGRVIDHAELLSKAWKTAAFTEAPSVASHSPAEPPPQAG